MSPAPMLGRAMHWGRWWIDDRRAGSGRAADRRGARDEAIMGLHDYHDEEDARP